MASAMCDGCRQKFDNSGAVQLSGLIFHYLGDNDKLVLADRWQPLGHTLCADCDKYVKAALWPVFSKFYPSGPGSCVCWICAKGKFAERSFGRAQVSSYRCSTSLYPSWTRPAASQMVVSTASCYECIVRLAEQSASAINKSFDTLKVMHTPPPDPEVAPSSDKILNLAERMRLPRLIPGQAPRLESYSNPVNLNSTQ